MKTATLANDIMTPDGQTLQKGTTLRVVQRNKLARTITLALHKPGEQITIPAHEVTL